jgi:hypothetical protein
MPSDQKLSCSQNAPCIQTKLKQGSEVKQRTVLAL